MNRITLEVGSYAVNCSILERNGQVAIVDPGQEADRIAAELDKRGWTPSVILLTHGHYDHTNAIPALLRRWPALKVGVTAEDAAVMVHPFNALPPEYRVVPLAHPIAPEAALGVFAPDAVVIPTPGHSPGGVCYHFPSEKLLLSGDTLFAGSVGRSDLLGGDMKTLMTSLERLKTLPPETTVIPGHGMFTTIADELAGNPFLA